MESGGDATSEFPADRGWDVEALYDPTLRRAGTSYVRRGGFLADAAGFDAGFFGISPREALAMDPQQRVLLETVWEALERAGIDAESLRGSATGTFIGAIAQEYGPRMYQAAEETAGYALTGSMSSVVSGRVAYTLGLRGPAVTVDTACSSSLVALHQAVQALRRGECGLALAGGVTVLGSPGVFVEFSRQGGLSRDGRCRSFGAKADGTGFGEGAGVVVLERLSDALERGHRVWGVVRGSAVGSDGASNGLSAPSGAAQEAVIRAALADARVDPGRVGVVEGHGTGTVLGDPIEAGALGAVYGRAGGGSGVIVGSVKANIAHVQAAAGVAGLISLVGILGRGVVPPLLGAAGGLSELVDWDGSGLEVVAEGPRTWDGVAGRRIGGVSSFGISGTNAHAIIEETPEGAVRPRALARTAPAPRTGASDASEACARTAADSGGAPPWPLSGHTPHGLRAQAARLHEHLLDHPEAGAADVGRALAVSRTHLDHRAVVLGTDRDDRLAGLAALARGETPPNAVRGRGGAPGKTVFVFPGQGAQWPGMAAELLADSAVFRERIAECEAALAPHVDWSLSAVLRGAPGAPGAPGLDRVDVVQPALWAVMVALAGLWRACGVRPDAVVGHSQGEVAAAHVAGALCLEDAARVAALRSRAVHALAGEGAMAQIPLPADRVRTLIAGRAGGGGRGVCVAAVNGPASTVVSGERAAVRRLVEETAASGVRARMIAVDYASHSAHMEALRSAVLADLDGISSHRPRIPFHSTVTGRPVGEGDLDAEYWYANLRRPVEFAAAVRTLAENDHGLFLEMSPHPVLAMAVEQTAEEAAEHSAADGEAPPRAAVVGSLRRDDGGWPRFAASVAEAYAHGAAVDWSAVYAGHPPSPVELPTYAFQRTRYWLAPRPEPAAAAGAEPGTGAAHERFWAAVADGDADSLAAVLGTSPEPVHALMPALADWHRRGRRRAALDSLCYRDRWVPACEAPAPPGAGRWLVLLEPAGSTDPARAWYDALAARGMDVVPLELKRAEADRASLGALLRENGAAADGAAGVLCLLTLDARGQDAAAASAAGPALAAAVLQAMEDAGVDAPLWCATQGAVSTGEDDPLRTPAQAPVWGLGRVAAQEYPRRWGGLVDLPARPDRATAALLHTVLCAPGREDQLAVRAAGVRARRLVRAPAPAARSPWRPAGTVLITGGTGALGAHTARYLAGRGGPHLHLLLAGRRGPDAPGAAALAADLRATGTGVTLAACDVADRSALEHLLASVPAEHPLSAVVHTAAVLDDAPIADLGAARMEAAMATKAGAARHLHELTADTPLSAFLLYSSVSGMLGVAGHGNYAPANAYLDALARHRRAAGLPATSLAWGAWDGAGMAGRGDVAALLRRHGMPGMPPENAAAALDAAFTGDAPAAFAVADIDWRRFAVAFTAARAGTLLDDLPDARRAAGGAAPDASAAGADPAADLRRRLAAAAPPERTRMLRALVREHVAATLGHDSPAAVDEARPFTDLGLDSVMAVDLRNRLSAATGLRLPAALAFDHPTAAAAAAHLGSRLGSGDDPARPPEDGSGPGEAELAALEALLPTLDPGDPRRSGIAHRLRALASAAAPAPAPAAADPSLHDATPDELFALIDDELGDG
ncbi:type I polyketide synthase [Streptomonospora sp. PA3]|uniref:type I polyketide synthase n=1 Tax=Streptomonospora sp. PA3 TaxID=2607326 RepID=UPI0031B9DD53